MRRDFSSLEAELRDRLASVLNGAPLAGVTVRPVDDYRRDDVPAVDVTIDIGHSREPIPANILSPIFDIVFEIVAAFDDKLFPYVFTTFAHDQEVAAA